jgi:hypothetical protein
MAAIRRREEAVVVVVAHPFRDAVWVGGLAAPRPHALPGSASASRTDLLLRRRTASSSSTEALARHGRRLLLRENQQPSLIGDYRFS